MKAIYKRKTMASGEIIIEFYACEILREMKSSVEVRLSNWYGDYQEKNPVKKVQKKNIRVVESINGESQQALFDAWKTGKTIGSALP